MSVLVGLALCSPYIHPHEEQSFVAHMRWHGLVYTGSEYHLRVGIFIANLGNISEFNSGEHSFRLGLTNLATLTPSEYRSAAHSGPRSPGDAGGCTASDFAQLVTLARPRGRHKN
jgi:hypothetical protein